MYKIEYYVVVCIVYYSSASRGPRPPGDLQYRIVRVCVSDVFNEVSTRLGCQAHLYDRFPQ
jgi:hypothetical protein